MWFWEMFFHISWSCDSKFIWSWKQLDYDTVLTWYDENHPLTYLLHPSSFFAKVYIFLNIHRLSLPDDPRMRVRTCLSFSLSSLPPLSNQSENPWTLFPFFAWRNWIFVPAWLVTGSVKQCLLRYSTCNALRLALFFFKCCFFLVATHYTHRFTIGVPPFHLARYVAAVHSGCATAAGKGTYGYSDVGEKVPRSGGFARSFPPRKPIWKP